MIVFGPVPSRRLGSSLGINHIPPKYCSFSCVYCQVGRTDHLTINRRHFYPPDEIRRQVDEVIEKCNQAGKQIDYLTLVPDGEPTLDIHLGVLIRGLKRTGLPVAVISNGSLLTREEVRSDLLGADWVSVKLDTIDEEQWRRIDRPHGTLRLADIMAGMITFRGQYQGVLATETMLVDGYNDQKTHFERLCRFLLELRPDRSYLSLPIRPPAEADVLLPRPERLQELLNICSALLPKMEFLFEAESGNFVLTGDFAESILSICAVHPIREHVLVAAINAIGGDQSIVDRLVQTRDLSRISYRSDFYYLRSHRSSDQS